MKTSRFFRTLLVLAIIFSIFAIQAIAEDNIKVLLNDEELSFDVPPQLIKNRTMIPMRRIFEALGAEVKWDNDTGTVIVTKDDVDIIMKIGNNVISVNGKEITLDVPPQFVNSRTLIPVRAVAESLDAKVEWNNDTQTVIITKAENLGSTTILKSKHDEYVKIIDKSALDIAAMNQGLDHEIVYSADEEQVTGIFGKFSNIKVKSPEDAIAAIYSVRSLIGISAPADDLVFVNSNTSDIGVSYRFKQTYEGVEVYGGLGITIIADPNGNAYYLDCSLIREEYLPVNPTHNVSYEEAVAIAEGIMGGKVNVLEARPVIYSLDEHEYFPVFAYCLNVIGYNKEGSLVVAEIIICAYTGDFLSFNTPYYPYEVVISRGSGNNAARVVMPGVSSDSSDVPEEVLTDVTFNIRNGWNMKTGHIIDTVVVDDKGNYSFYGNSGNYTFEAKKDGYITKWINVSIREDKELNQDIVMCENEITVAKVLDWSFGRVDEKVVVRAMVKNDVKELPSRIGFVAIGYDKNKKVVEVGYAGAFAGMRGGFTCAYEVKLSAGSLIESVDVITPYKNFDATLRCIEKGYYISDGYIHASAVVHNDTDELENATMTVNGYNKSGSLVTTENISLEIVPKNAALMNLTTDAANVNSVEIIIN